TSQGSMRKSRKTTVFQPILYGCSRPPFSGKPKASADDVPRESRIQSLARRFMKRLYRFLKSTILGGLLILVPLIVLGAVSAWAIASAAHAASPLMQWLPDPSVAGVSLAFVIVVLGVIATCFLVGLFAQTALLRYFGDRAERFAMYIPGY